MRTNISNLFFLHGAGVSSSVTIGHTTSVVAYLPFQPFSMAQFRLHLFLSVTTVDALAREPMKNAAKCDTHRDVRKSENR